MSHANAALTPRSRLKVAQLVVDQGWPISEVAARFQVSWPTVKRWADRYADAQPMTDRSSRPRHQPGRTPAPVVRRVLDLRWRKRLGPLQLAAWTGVAASTVHKILVRNRLNRLNYVDRATGEPVRRYEHPYPGSLIHVDVKKLGNIPDGGGWRFVGRVQGERNKAGTPGKQRNKWHNALMRHAFVHTVIDDHTRIAYAEIHDDETALTATAVLVRAVAWYAARGITVERVLSDNGSAYKSYAWRDACTELGITAKKTRPYRPQTNGKVERFNRTLANEWAYAHPYRSEADRAATYQAWLHEYNHHRPHGGIGGQNPIDRVSVHNLSGNYI